METKNELIAELFMLAVLTGYAFVYCYEVFGMGLMEQKLFVLVITGFLFLLALYRGIELVLLTRKAPGLFVMTLKGLKSRRFVYFITLVVYFILTPVFGFFPATFLFLILFLVVFGMASRWTLVAFPAIFTGSLYVIFKLFLNVRLPQGMFF
jgi:hypothetical protein